MRKLGTLLIAAGFLAGAYAAVTTVRGVPWEWFLPALGVGVVGVVLVQLGMRGRARAHDVVDAGLETLTAALGRLTEGSRGLAAEAPGLDPYQVRHEIDRRLLADLDTFAEAREAIAHRYGLQPYADVMSHFATGERYLNRAWSASADGYPDEVATSLARARDELAEAEAMLGRVAGAGG